MPKSRLYIAASLAILAFGSWSSNQAETSACRVPSADALPDTYPAHHLSPKQSLAAYDAVFVGEVIVPNRPCSLGFCAGLKVVSNLKGTLPRTVLVQTQRRGVSTCGPANFNHKGQQWVVFANQGTSKSGQVYVQSDDETPSFPSPVLPDFQALETRYTAMRARLDQAIEERLGRTVVR